MPLNDTASKVKASMEDTYGKDKGERVFYATASKQKRKPETWKKQAAAVLQLVLSRRGKS
jgi:hypothetical protein